MVLTLVNIKLVVALDESCFYNSAIYMKYYSAYAPCSYIGIFLLDICDADCMSRSLPYNVLLPITNKIIHALLMAK